MQLKEPEQALVHIISEEFSTWLPLVWPLVFWLTILTRDQQWNSHQALYIQVQILCRQSPLLIKSHHSRQNVL